MLAENIKNYFKKKTRDEEIGNSPEGVCPNCWGKQEWEGEFYEQMKAQNITPESDTYNNFIKEFVTKNIVGIKIKEDTFTCTTCNLSQKK